MINRMNEVEGGIEKMALGHNYFGAHCLQGAQLRSDYLFMISNFISIPTKLVVSNMV